MGITATGGVSILVERVGGDDARPLLAFIIDDSGPGVPEEARERIFERFYSLRHHSARRKGTGLGLTLVKEAAELHGGSISLDAADGGGTVARFTLPLA